MCIYCPHTGFAHTLSDFVKTYIMNSYGLLPNLIMDTVYILHHPPCEQNTCSPLIMFCDYGYQCCLIFPTIELLLRLCYALNIRNNYFPLTIHVRYH